jgi:hypothetical protein
MSTQTVLNIILSAVTVYLGIRNFALTQKKEAQQESQEMTEIRVQYSQVVDMLHDLQKEMKNVSVLSERVVVIETNLAEIYRRIEKLEGNGK